MFDEMLVSGHVHLLIRFKLPVLGLGFWTPSLIHKDGIVFTECLLMVAIECDVRLMG